MSQLIEVTHMAPGTPDDGVALVLPPFDVLANVQHALTWFPELGYGYFECVQSGEVYGQDYFDRYAAQAETPTGRRLMAARVDLVRRHLGDIALSTQLTVDVGIGSGAFVEAMIACGYPAHGYDVNPAGIAWLKERGLWADLFPHKQCDVVTFWDSLEHIRDIRGALARCSRWAFVALPIFRDAEHVLVSKHFRRDEHYHYFTRAGFRRFAEASGFEVVDIVASETALGREDVETFVLRRRADALRAPLA